MPTGFRCALATAFGALLLGGLTVVPIGAETITFNGQTVDVSTLPPEVQAKIRSGEIKLPAGAVMSGAAVPVAGAPPKKEGEGAAGGEGEKKDEGGKAPDEGVATIKRGAGDAGAPDANELKAKPDKDGMVQFSFRNQPWSDVLQWYADVASCSLDWQELPADNLNLVTQRRYSLPETRDLLNRHLLARGFTMLLSGEVLSVVKVDKIDPSLVPRVAPDDLEDHLPHDFARVRFDLPETMDPAKAVEDVKVLLNPSAKVTPLLASKQLLVIDAVANLRDVRDLIYGEQLATADDIRPELFPIRYRRAEYIADQIMIVLGLDPSSRKTPMELQIEQQRMQLLMQMQGSGKDVTNLLRQDGPPVFLAVDRRRNTVSVNAPPKEMEIVRRVVKQFDVPGVAGDEMASEELTTRRYQTVTVSPDSIVTALKEIANLSPLTQLQSDSASKTIFATATAADHETIQGMIDKLDGSGRALHVIWLSRRSPADQIAGTIHALMVGEKKQENNRRPWYYYDYYGGNQQQEPDTGFRIQADVDNNRLIMMATDAEYAEVTKMLEELGVVTSERRGNPNTWRVLEARDPADTAEMLERLREAWGGRNPLNIHVAPPADEPAAEEPANDGADQGEDSGDENEDTLTQSPAAVRSNRPVVRFAQLVEGEPATEEPAAGQPAPVHDPEDASAPVGAPPINLTVTPDGRIVISSDDPVALDQFEDLLNEIAPPQREYKIYELTNADCIDVWYNLKDYYHDELADDETDDFYSFWNGNDNNETPATLGKPRKLRFIYDTTTNTVLVQNASPAQLQTIDKLVKIYDQPPAEDAVRRRKTELVQVRYSRAADIAAAIKEVYRDLLSSKDKEFQDREGNQRGSGRREIYYRFPGTDNKKSAPVKMAFEGALSIGVDSISNTLIISAEEQIFDSIRQIVTTLDEQARPDTVVQVHQIEGALSAEDLQRALSTALSRPWPGGKPENAAAGQQNGQGGGNRGDGEGRRWRGRGRGRD